MVTTITCPRCGLQGELPDGMTASQSQCPRCGTVVDAAAGPPLPPGPQPPGSQPPGPWNPLLDHFFAAAFTQRPLPPGPDPATAFPGGIPGSPLPPGHGPSPPPANAPVENNAVEERLRFQAYMRYQLSALQQQRQELDKLRSQTDAELAARERDLDREKRFLADRRKSIDERDAQNERHSPAAEQFQREIAAEKARLDELRKAVAGVRADYLALEKAVRARKQTSEEQHATTALSKLERAGQSLSQRERELRELETQIRGELDNQEQDLARQRRELQEWHDRLVQDSCEKDVLRRKLGTLARQLEQLRAKAPPGDGPSRP